MNTPVETNGRSKVNWNTFIAASGLLVTVMIALGGMAMYAITTPIRAEQEGTKKSLELALSSVNLLREKDSEITDLKIQRANDVTNARLIEVESQFRGSDEARNIQFATQQRIDALLWEKVFGVRYPSDATYYPHISK